MIAMTVLSALFLAGCTNSETSKPGYSQSKTVSDVMSEQIEKDSKGGDGPSGVIPKAETKTEEIKTRSESSYDQIDIDLTVMNADITYAQVYDMMSVPESYVGKTVKAKGVYSYWEDPATGNVYKTVIITDALACCAQGIEFKEKEGQILPEFSMENPTEITVTGEFGYYLEDNFLYIELRNAEVKITKGG